MRADASLATSAAATAASALAPCATLAVSGAQTGATTGPSRAVLEHVQVLHGRYSLGLCGTCWLGVAGGGRSGIECSACARKHISVPQIALSAFTATSAGARTRKTAQRRDPYVPPGEGPRWRNRAWPVDRSWSVCGGTGLQNDPRYTTQQQSMSQRSGLPSLCRLCQAPEQVRLVLDGSKREKDQRCCRLAQYQLVQGKGLWRRNCTTGREKQKADTAEWPEKPPGARHVLLPRASTPRARNDHELLKADSSKAVRTPSAWRVPSARRPSTQITVLH